MKDRDEDTPSPLPKEDTFPRCQTSAEAPDCKSSQTAEPNLQDTCHHHKVLHKVPHRNFVLSSHFHFPINREQYPSKKGNYFLTFTVTLPKLPLIADLNIEKPSVGTTPVPEA
ncbi:hypothetical protein L3X38_022422 [Prunus dulcis]|uniref:Uncharacterized protein n=1 Tax=Prunus dulcis TaxID=3755 RepID=A0AAD4VX55_PRUDU|nr:hypothetical protein L3X38_022422 [Prunus dulcis]